ncbi:MAG TPA: DUF134 domain-containing protein [Oscillospiraceae bacterium]|nr:DUF134 domain-containing protein [Oscillospiraceae bacterium]HPS34225.1 DUF134 domain-containing protein [Oscillospiraceae bacterium]
MPRPIKPRYVCRMPKFGCLQPGAVSGGEITLTVEEYEVIRLIDLENNTQEECARQMRVARTTAQGIYETARRKLAKAIVEGRSIVISGGDYILCGQYTCECGNGCGRVGAHGCRRRCIDTDKDQKIG